MKRFVISGLIILAMTAAVQAQPAATPMPDLLSQLLPAQGGAVSGKIVQYLLLLTVLSLAPGLLIMVTSFTRIIIALSFLRSGLGLQTTPANLVMVSLALFLTFFVMAPTFTASWEQGLKPYSDGQISDQVAYERITTPFRDFMVKQVREKDLALFQEVAAETRGFGEARDARDLRILVPAFMISELRRGFEMGFLIALPFLVIDLIVATVTMAMGMMMLPPTIISLPFKILFFVLVDGWSLLAGSLIRSFSG
jgi:flagellar biosynthetic protein FliP